MSQTPTPFSEADLQRALTDLGRHLEYPPVPDLSGDVRAHVDQLLRRRSFRRHIFRSTVLYPVVAAVVILASVLALSPGARSAVASWFNVVGVQIEFGSKAPGPLGHNLNLGQQVSLAEAQTHVAFPILIPTSLGKPDGVYIGTPPLVGSVSLVYRTRSNLPRAAATGAGLLITEYRRYFLDVKLLTSGSTVAPVTIRGEPAVWLSGLPHVMYDLDPHGRLVRDTIRLAGNVLVWYHGGVTVRLEGQIPEDRAIEIARSMTAGRWSPFVMAPRGYAAPRTVRAADQLIAQPAA